jgi:hypothetical protein
MNRAYRFAVIGFIWILAMIIHYFGATIFAPGTDVYALGAPGVGTFIEAGWRDDMYTVFVQYIPLLFVAMSLVWGFASEYEQQRNTRRVR